MSTSKAWDIATHVGDSGIRLPTAPAPSPGKILVVNSKTGTVANMGWGDPSGMPVATAEGQVLVSGDNASGYAWAADIIDSGRY